MGREASRVQITITDIQGRGKCPLGFKKGDTWLIGSYITPTKFCMEAWHAVYPRVRTMRFGGEHPFGESDVHWACCPDFINPVVFEIRRLPTKPSDEVIRTDEEFEEMKRQILRSYD